MELQVFNNDLFGEIRVGLIDNEPWFVGRDVVERLGYEVSKTTSYTKFINKYCSEEDIKKVNNSTAELFGIKDAGRKGEILINEFGLYDLVLDAPLPSAKAFRKWVTHEVLPSIRANGGYIPTNETDTDAEIMAKALLIAQKTIENKNQKIKELEPKAEVYDRFIDKEATWGFRELRKELESTLGFPIKENEFKEILRDKGWIGKTLKALSYAIRNNYMVTKDVEDKFGNPRTQDRFTTLAREELLDYFKNK